MDESNIEVVVKPAIGAGSVGAQRFTDAGAARAHAAALQEAGNTALVQPYDPRVEEAVGVVVRRRGADGRWPLDPPLPGRPAVAFEIVGEPSRWNTLRALRVLDWAGVQSTP